MPRPAPEDILIRITAWNRGPEPARLHILPTLWFRNRWAWGDNYDPPQAYRIDAPPGTSLIEMSEYHYGKRWLLLEGAPELLFTENETNTERLFQFKNRTPYVKDAFHRYVVNGEQAAVNPAWKGHEGRRAIRRGNRARKKLDHLRSSAGPETRRESGARETVLSGRASIRYSPSESRKPTSSTRSARTLG